MRMKKLVAGILAATMMLSTAVTGYAAETSELTDGTYTAGVHMYQNNYAGNSGKYSMCAGLFAAESDITISGDDVTVKLYVANPIPSFVEASEAATDGILSDVIASVEDAEFYGTVEVKNAADRYFDKAALGTVAGESYDCDTITIVMDKDALTADYIDVQATINVVMDGTQYFDLVLTDLTEVAGGSSDNNSDSDVVVDVQEVPVTAKVELNTTTYTVTVPESVPFGVLSSASDNTVDYKIDVEVVAGNDNKAVQVTTAAEGTLLAGTETIAFTNSFGTQTFATTGAGNGTLTVTADAVAGIAAGEYAGTVSFEINSVDK